MKHTSSVGRRLSHPGVIPAVALTLISLLIGPLMARTWTSADGKRTFEGDLESYDPAKKQVTVRLPNGKSVKFREDRLLEEDVAWVKTQDANPAERRPDDVRAKEIQDMKWGMFVCWSFSTFYGKEWTPTLDKDASYFKATGCDTDQWCRTAKEAGMGYILFLAKHHDGFCLWDTDTTDKKVTNSPLGIDVLAELRKSCDKHGIKLALYFSEGDWNWPGAVDGKGAKGFSGGQNAEMKKAQLKELLTGYGPVEFWWMDHAAGNGGLGHQDTVDWVHQFQPNSFVGFNHGEPAGRLCLRERGRAGKLGDASATKYNKDAEAKHKGYLVAEFTYPILPKHQGGADWFYSLPKHDGLCHPASKLFTDYQGARKFGNIFSINIGPNYEGKLREVDVKTLTEVGRMIREAE